MPKKLNFNLAKALYDQLEYINKIAINIEMILSALL